MTDNPVPRARAAMAHGPLLLSSSSYLFPTLRLDRRETPQSLAARLKENEVDPCNNNGAFGKLDWCCPVILDVSELTPDGSPHFQPPLPGSLLEMVSILRGNNLQVMGLTCSSGNMLPTFQEEAAQFGIPNVRVARSGSSAATKFDVSEIIQLVRTRNEQERLRYDHEKEFASQSTNHDEGSKRAASLVKLEANQASLQEARKEKESGQQQQEQQEASLSGAGSKDIKSNAPASIEYSSSSTLYHGSVRSGQQVMSSKGQSLVILGSVNSGGEVLSDGDIFVFGKLRGRAFAGLGNSSAAFSNSESRDKTSARIVATSFDAELVAIGDVFTTIDRVEDLAADTKLRAGQAIMVTLTGNESQFLNFGSICP